MDWSLLPRGVVIGLSVAAPVGPMAILCMSRTLAQGRLAGFVSGLGIATADACYGAIAAFGLTSVANALVEQSSWIRVLGGLFLVYLGVKTVRSQPLERTGQDGPRRPADGLMAYGSTLGLTLTNPTTILSFVAIFAGFGVASGDRETTSAAALVIGVFAGSAFWWFILTSGTGLLRDWLTVPRLTWINRVSGAVIGVFGALAVASLFR
ncbi:MAG TPA: LysE family translocator [Thermomicrobiales bacterium]|jgi:threonine/homoserine/homoserine lactone efflux protein